MQDFLILEPILCHNYLTTTTTVHCRVQNTKNKLTPAVSFSRSVTTTKDVVIKNRTYMYSSQDFITYMQLLANHLFYDDFVLMKPNNYLHQRYPQLVYCQQRLQSQSHARIYSEYPVFEVQDWKLITRPEPEGLLS